MLRIQNLVKVYPGPVTALSGIDLDLPRGLFGLLGPNGSGKTTLMSILAGLLAPTDGRIFWQGQDVTQHPERLWPLLGYLPQDFGFYPELSGRAMLAYLLRLKGVSAPGGLNRLCDALLERVNLSAAAHRRVGDWSGGMRQRLGIAQAIAGEPDLLVVDEPTVGLDPEERLRFQRLLAELANERVVLLSTHLVEDVAHLCPRVAVIRAGRLLANTTPQEACRALDGLVHSGFVDEERLEQLTRTSRVTQTRLQEGRIQVRLYCPEGTGPQGFRPVDATLEDAYLVMTRSTSNQISRPTRSTEQA
ncbi:MAG: ATP-binding cassette domain-containing protein [Candidatus Cloacimonetes bacterium]|nr:ATP-binding cassette domain-containing protein [Candidatus Cloacimonadota bacterium]